MKDKLKPQPYRYKLEHDGDHHYAVPVRRAEDWVEWLNSEAAQCGGEVPAWAIRIDGRFTFTDPRCE